MPVQPIEVPSGLRARLCALSETERVELRHGSVEAIRLAWPHRDTMRGGIVVRTNVRMLRNLRNLGGSR